MHRFCAVQALKFRMHVFPSPGKNSLFRVISGYYVLLNPFDISGTITR